MAVVALEVSGETVTLTGEADEEARLRVTPLMALVTVLEVLLMGMPSTVSEALAPVTALVKLRPVVLFETVRSPGAPVVLLTRARREPLASLTTLAVTPEPRLLMEVARPSRVLLVESMATLTGVPLATLKGKEPVASGVLLVRTGAV